MPEAHAKLSPSAAERWFHCPGSVVLSETMPEKSSEYAEEGTRAHALAEQILKTGAVPPGADPDMLKHVMVYVDNVNDLFRDGEIRMIEKQVKVSDACWGTADALVWSPASRTLYVRDYKHGAGVGVDVQDNLQLKIYALAALLETKLPAKIVNVGIVQPRYNHTDGAIRSKDYDAVDLIEFHADLMEAMARVDKARANGDLYLKWAGTDKPLEIDARSEWEEKYLHPTDKGCRFCTAAPICPMLKNKAQILAKQVFAPTLPYKPEDLARTLDMLPILEGWIKNVREFAYTEAEKGNAIPDYKLVEKQATRQFKPGVEGELAKALGVPITDLFKMPTLLGVTEVQRMAPGKNDKERAEVLAPFVTKESSGHTLVHNSDKRPAVRIDAKAAFAEALG